MRWTCALLAAGGCGYQLKTEAPSLTDVTPALTCGEQLITEVVVHGKHLTPLPADVLTDKASLLLPSLRLERVAALDGSTASPDVIALPDARWVDDRTLVFDVHPDLGIAAGVFDLMVDNPDDEGAEATFESSMAVVPAPLLDAVSPNLFCVAQADQALVLSGQHFLVLGDAVPTAKLGALELMTTPSGVCVDLAGPVSGQICDGLDVTVRQGAVDVGLHALAVVNPQTAACETEEPLWVEVVAPPRLDEIIESLSCSEAENSFVLRGDGFLVIDGARPVVHIGGYSIEADGATDCTALQGPGGGETCATLTLTVPSDALQAGTQDVRVENPAPASCSSSDAVQLDIVTAPVVTDLTPPDLCENADDVVFTIAGASFVQLADGTLPTVEIDGVPVEVVGASGCVDLGPSGASTCTGLDVVVPTGTFVDVGGVHPVTVFNPAPAQCSSKDDVALTVVAPPTIDSVVPDPVCDSSTVFTVLGSGFGPGADVFIDGMPVLQVTYVDDTELWVEVSPGFLTPGLHDLTVTNGDGCEAAEAQFLDVIAGPVLFFVDPPVIYSQMITEVSLFVGGLNSAPVAVWIEEDATGVVFDLQDYTFDGENTVFLEVDAVGLGLAEGDYTVVIEDDQQCTPFLDSALYVEDDLTLQVESIDPPFAPVDAVTSVEIRAVESGSLLPGEVNLSDLPRVYLNPSAGGVATGLRSVTFIDETLLTGVVPEGLLPDVYDVIVVNPPPGNEIGLLPLAFEVTALPPPFVESVAPNRMSKSAPTQLLLLGRDFSNPAVEMTCRDAGGSVLPVDTCSVATWDAGSIDATCPSDAHSDGTVCVIRVTNDVGTYYDYSAVSVGSPSGNLFQFFAGEEMIEARRAPVVVSGRATDRGRFLYAIGGDGGDPLGALDTLEVSALDIFGTMRPWRTLPLSLLEPRTLAGSVVVDRFVYIVGGNDGTGAVDTVWRAQVLDPLNTPRLDTLGLSLGGGKGDGLIGGLYTYRISAVHDLSDPINPGGETLASDPIVVNVPVLPDLAHIDLTWTPVDTTVPVVGYRVYRTPVPDGGSGTEELLADESTVTGPAFTDTGAVTTVGTGPLPSGSLGAWSTVANLPGTDTADAAREGACVAVGRDPASDVSYLYVAGGRDGNGSARDSIQFLDLDTSLSTQPVGSFQTSTNTLDEPKWLCSRWVVNERFHSVVSGGETWIVFGMGDNGAALNKVNEAGLVLAGGELGNFQLVGDINTAKSGMATFAANNFLYGIGGATGSGPTERGHETSISLAVPLLDNWNSLGGVTLSTERWLAGAAAESAFWFIVGGADSGGSANATVDFTNL